MGIDSPLTGAPSMISYLATVSVSVDVLGPKNVKNKGQDVFKKKSIFYLHTEVVVW